MPVTEPWNGKLTRIEAVRILDRATDQDDPFWEHIVEDHYDEKADNIPTIMDVLAALGVTKEEYAEASDADNVDWPDAANGVRDIAAEMRSFATNMRRDDSDARDSTRAPYADALDGFADRLSSSTPL